MRDAFVASAMNDVPSVDYDQQMRDLAVQTCVDAMPKKLQALIKDPECEQWINTEYVRVPVPHTFSSPRTYCQRNSGQSIIERNPKAVAALRKLDAQRHAQREQREALRAKLAAAARACTTRKALVELLPEFEKYLPPDQPAACRTLPAVANIVADFTKAGWPKGRK